LEKVPPHSKADYSHFSRHPSVDLVVDLYLEAIMSKFHSSSGQPIPMGILVKAGKKADADRQRGDREPGERHIPWMWIATGGSIGWVVLVLTIAILTSGQERTQDEVRNMPRPIAVDGDLLAEAKLPRPVELIEEEAAPLKAPAPRLNRAAPVVPANDGPPLLDLPVEEPVALVPAVPLGPQPGKPARRQVDTKIYQSCDQIGTDVLFMKDPFEAYKKAKEEKKMVFMVHLSGNLEDPGFT